MPFQRVVYFLRSYLHEDFADFHGDDGGAIRDFVSEGSEEAVVMAVGGLAILLASDADEEKLEEFLRGANCPYRPVGETRRDWLQSVADRMVAAALERWPMGPSFGRPIFDAVLSHMHTLDPSIIVEPVSVGIFFRRRTTFLQLRTMSEWVDVCFNLERKLTSPRLSRQVFEHSGRYHHVVNVRSADEVDDELRQWLTEAFHADE